MKISEKSDLHQDAVARQLTIVGEATKRLSAEFRAAHAEVPWRDVAGFRDVIVHDYFRVDVERVWDVVMNHLPRLIATIEPLLPPAPAG